MDDKNVKVPEKLLDLDTSAINMVILILVLNALITVAFLVWQGFLGLLAEGSQRDVTIIIADIFLAYYLFKRKRWARTWIIVRSVFGCIVWGAMSFTQHDYVGIVTQCIFFGSIIALLSGKIEQFKARLLGLAAIVVLLYIGYQGVNGLLYHQKARDVISSVGQQSYTSSEFGYSVTAKDKWNIIERKDFEKTEKMFLKSDAEIALIRDDAMGYCLVIPESIPQYGVDFTMDGLMNLFLANIKGSGQAVEDVEAQLVSFNGHDGFEVKYALWAEGFHHRHMILYAIYGKVGMKIFTWALASHADDVFRDAKETLQSIKFTQGTTRQ